jgi:RNA polymerase sigma factor (sigma-70 family)
MGEIIEVEAPTDFTTTRWSEIQAARTATPEHREAVLENLARRYWKPVYCYLRARGQQDADARDITQDFFVEVILGRDLFGQAQPHRGRFRPFLLHCLKNFVRDRHRRERARGRSPNHLAVSIDQWADSESSRHLPPTLDDPPEKVFHRRWAASLLEEVLDRLCAACQRSELHVHFELFRQRVVRPALERVKPGPVEELARRYGLTAKQVSNRVETVRRRFRRLLLDEVRLTVMDDTAAEEELRSLMGHLSRRAG